MANNREQAAFDRSRVPPRSLSHLLRIHEEPFAEPVALRYSHRDPHPDMVGLLISTRRRSNVSLRPGHTWLTSGDDTSYCGTVTVPVPGFGAIPNTSFIEIGRIVVLESQLDPGKLVCLLYQSDDLLMYGGVYHCWGGPVLSMADWERLSEDKKQAAVLSVQTHGTPDKAGILRSMGLLRDGVDLQEIPLEEIYGWFRRVCTAARAMFPCILRRLTRRG